MPHESTIPTSSYEVSRRFAVRLALFYGTVFALIGTYSPFFPMWLKGIGIDAAWIGLIIAVPSLARFTVLPFITAFAERRQALRAAMRVCALVTFLGFSLIGTLTQPLAVLIAFAAIACAWTPLVPLTDGYALKAVARYGLNYGPLRLWGSAAFIAGALGCGLLAREIAPSMLIVVIAAAGALGLVASFGLKTLDTPPPTGATHVRASALLRDPGFLAIIGSAALVQGSHAAYYTFSSITWQADGFDSLTIAVLWAIGVIAEIVVFAVSPRFTWAPTTLMALGASSAVLRWVITAQDLPLLPLAVVQSMHGLSFGVTQVGTMLLMLRLVPHHLSASAQGYLTACTGLAMSVSAASSGEIYARFGQKVYFAMAVLALAGAVTIWLARRRLDAHHPAVG